jgi:hypothetical protein
MYSNKRIVAKNLAEGLNRFSKYSGIDLTLEYTRMGNQPNIKKGTKNQSFKYVMVDEIPC